MKLFLGYIATLLLTLAFGSCLVIIIMMTTRPYEAGNPLPVPPFILGAIVSLALLIFVNIKMNDISN